MTSNKSSIFKIVVEVSVYDAAHVVSGDHLVNFRLDSLQHLLDAVHLLLQTLNALLAGCGLHSGVAFCDLLRGHF